MIAKVVSAGANLPIDLASMYFTFFHVDPKRREQRKRKSSTKNQKRDNQPASPFVSQKGRDRGDSADYQKEETEDDVGTVQ